MRCHGPLSSLATTLQPAKAINPKLLAVDHDGRAKGHDEDHQAHHSRQPTLPGLDFKQGESQIAGDSPDDGIDPQALAGTEVDKGGYDQAQAEKLDDSPFPHV